MRLLVINIRMKTAVKAVDGSPWFGDKEERWIASEEKVYFRTQKGFCQLINLIEKCRPIMATYYSNLLDQLYAKIREKKTI
ncbi:unnamed protein product, partial [Acanthoscelides obtectus]